MCRLLVASNANVAARNECCIPLHSNSCVRHVPHTHCFFSSGYSIGKTAIEMAIDKNKANVAAYLRSIGGRDRSRDRGGERDRAWAERDRGRDSSRDRGGGGRDAERGGDRFSGERARPICADFTRGRCFRDNCRLDVLLNRNAFIVFRYVLDFTFVFPALFIFSA